MFLRIKILCLLTFAAEIVLLGAMVYYTSWRFLLGYLILSALAGLWVLQSGLTRHSKEAWLSLQEGESPAEPLFNAIVRFAAGVLLIVPGVLTDLVALLLFTPLGIWLAGMVLFYVIDLPMPFPSFRKQKSSSKNIPAKDEIIDVQVKKEE